jgi:hypothetical protein
MAVYTVVAPEGWTVAVPGRKVPAGAPTELADTELFAVDAYLREFNSPVVEVDEEQPGWRCAVLRSFLVEEVNRTTSVSSGGRTAPPRSAG